MKKNILFILADDLGSWALSSYGNKEVITPNLQQLSDDGIQFDNFYCTSPVCSPARASIMTGRMPSAHGVFDWINSGNIDINAQTKDIQSNPIFSNERKPIEYLEGLENYPDLLAQNGYECALVGKWHLGNSSKKQMGFNTFKVIARGGCNYKHPDIINDKGLVEFKDEYITDIITNDAIDFLSQKHDKPFYLSVHYTAPHSPWNYEDHKKEHIDLYKDCPFNSAPILPLHKNQIETCPHGEGLRRIELLTGYYSAITSMDEGIGKIIETLKKQGLYDNTTIIFLSDNGMNLGQHGVWGKGNGTFPMNMYDSSIKVPFIIKHNDLKGRILAPHSQYDIFPSIMDIALINHKNNEYMPGSSFINELYNPNDQKEHNVVVYDEYGPVRMIRNDQYKYIHVYPYGPNEFYDLVNDPDETVNEIDNPKFIDIIASMNKDLIKWFNKYTDPKLDGTKEAVKGTGQSTKGGEYSEGKDPYAPMDYYPL